MNGFSEVFTSLTADPRHASETALVDTLCAVNNARRPARAAMATSALARDFIYAAQQYQVDLRYAYITQNPASPLRRAYELARHPVPCPVKGEIPDLMKNRIRAELALLDGHEPGLQSLDQMIATGCRYMRSRPDLALTLDLPLPEKLWNRVKLGFCR